MSIFAAADFTGPSDQLIPAGSAALAQDDSRKNVGS